MVPELSIATDYLKDTGDPEPYLKKISEAGFTHVHWCHEWGSDYIYSEHEINKIITLLKKYNLKALDIHASEGRTTNWLSRNESSRASSINLVKNRIYMASKLSCDAIILEFRREPINENEKQTYWNTLHKSLNELKPYAKKYNIKIALENYNNKECTEVQKLFSEYDSDFLGFCYDSGHGNIDNGLETLEKLKDRLIAIHLHDNDGESDQHKFIFSGTLDWDKLAKILAKSAYKRCVNMEINMSNSNILDETAFLSMSHSTGLKFSKLIESYRTAPMLMSPNIA
jgi:sugar phosphate isomerase/epimerase